MQSTTAQRLREMFALLVDHFGPQGWWPAETELEMMVGAILTQNTNWKNVQGAIANLKQRAVLSLEGLSLIPVGELAEAIRPAGYFNIKAKRIKNLIHFISEHYRGDLSHLLRDEPGVLREGLLSVKGIGPETADSILLYAARLPIFVIDTYTHRILSRHGMADAQGTYDDLQALFMDHLPDDPTLFNEFHALIVRTAKTYCRKTPLCSDCPLETWGPESPRR